MLISGTVAIVAMTGAMIALTLGAVVLAWYDHHFDAKRRHWKPAESSTHW